MTATAPVLECRQLTGGYGHTTVLRDIDLVVPTRSVAAVLGPNGAGKSTLLKTITGLVRPQSGHVLLDGEDITGQRTHRLARRGVCLIPEGRGIYRSLTVRDNLQLYVPPGTSSGDGLDAVIEMFPKLGARMRQVAGTMSGGEQQMLALARAFLSSPKVVLIDELSMGLAPLIVEQLFESLRQLVAQGIAILIVEQYVAMALDLADVAYLISNGEITFGGPAKDLDREQLARHYLTDEVDSTAKRQAANGLVN